MTDFIQSLLLSDPVIFILVSIGVIAVSFWAFARREFAGYSLGWLLGMFLVLVFSTLFTRANPDAEESGLSFLVVFFPGLIGISIGMGLRVLYTSITPISSGRSRAIAIAFSMSALLAGGYLMLLSSFAVRGAIGIFALGLIIGMLSHMVFTRARPRVSARVRAQDAQTYPDDQENGYLEDENEIIEGLIGNARHYGVVPNVSNGGSNRGPSGRRYRQGRPPRI